MQIHPAAIGDENGIAAVHIRAWQTGYRHIVADEYLNNLDVRSRAARWLEVIRDQTCDFIVAKIDGKVAGFTTFGESRSEQSPKATGEIWTLYVDPQYWRCGVGKALMTEALTSLRSSGFENVLVWVLQDNNRAIAFYQSCGFAIEPSSSQVFKLG
ncbi:GNAT family N-acetyltransferase [Pseudaquabacterium pictum]|uniref:N-acetyltransferase n=1 Tax=Pseudaquabacterium pictum TaxID=2315236 RepID=A0A480AMJ2_9BURK|nr:N-acetyltransferase [Rubrivivax pictus]